MLQRLALEVMRSATNRATRRPKKGEEDSDYQQDDAENPQNVDREHEPQDEQDYAKKDHDSPLIEDGRATGRLAFPLPGCR